MTSTSSFTGRKLGLDNNVWMVMVFFCLLSIGLFGYSYISNNEPCIPLFITINALPTEKESIHFTNEPLTFKVASAAGKNITWDFGDKSASKEGFIATHVFKQEGSFLVTAKFNGLCQKTAKVNIKNPVLVRQDLTNISIGENIFGTDFPKVGKEEVYSYSAQANSYEWAIKNNSNFSVQRGPKAFFKFSTPGPYTIELVLDNDATKKGYKEITVLSPAGFIADNSEKKPTSTKLPDFLPPLPDPGKIPRLIKEDKTNIQEKTAEATEKKPETTEKTPEKTPEKQPNIATEGAAPRKILLINNDVFKTLLESVVDGQLDVEDFNKYLVYKDKTVVRLNGKTTKSFGDFIDEIRGKNKIDIESVEIKREEDNINNIQQIRISYSKENIFDRLKSKKNKN